MLRKTAGIHGHADQAGQTDDFNHTDQPDKTKHFNQLYKFYQFKQFIPPTV